MEVKDRYRRFGEWKQQPHQVAPLSEEVHKCATCGTRYEGNYCPRCGQSARIGRYSFKKQRQQGYRDIDWIFDNVRKCLDEHSSLVMLVGLLLFSLPLWLLVRRGPAIPDLRLSECFVTMVYISNMLILYNIIPSLLCFSVKAEIVYNLLTMLLIFIPVKQLSGYSYVSTVWRVMVLDEFDIHPAKESEVKIVDWDRTYFLTKYYKKGIFLSLSSFVS